MNSSRLRTRDAAATRQDPHLFSETERSRIAEVLALKLGPEFVSSRVGPGGTKLSYLEGWKVIELANDILGFNGWSTAIIDITVDFLDCENGKYSLGISAIVRVTLKDGIFHEDVGYGSIENSRSKIAAFEKAKKEAITDALKRALRSFGSSLGNCLYDKEYMKKVTKLQPPKHRTLNMDDLYRHKDFMVEQTRPKSSAQPHAPHPLTTPQQQQQQGSAPVPMSTALESTTTANIPSKDALTNPAQTLPAPPSTTGLAGSSSASTSSMALSDSIGIIDDMDDEMSMIFADVEYMDPKLFTDPTTSIPNVPHPMAQTMHNNHHQSPANYNAVSGTNRNPSLQPYQQPYSVSAAHSNQQQQQSMPPPTNLQQQQQHPPTFLQQQQQYQPPPQQQQMQSHPPPSRPHQPSGLQHAPPPPPPRYQQPSPLQQHPQQQHPQQQNQQQKHPQQHQQNQQQQQNQHQQQQQQQQNQHQPKAVQQGQSGSFPMAFVPASQYTAAQRQGPPGNAGNHTMGGPQNGGGGQSSAGVPSASPNPKSQGSGGWTGPPHTSQESRPLGASPNMGAAANPINPANPVTGAMNTIAPGSIPHRGFGQPSTGIGVQPDHDGGMGNAQSLTSTATGSLGTGGLAGSAARLLSPPRPISSGFKRLALTYPLVTVSTRQQVTKSARTTQYNAAIKILKEEGVQGLYSGISSAMFGIAVTQYIYYYWYEFIKAAYEAAAQGRALTIVENMVTGAIAGAATATITNPIWVVNTRLVVKKESMDDDGKKAVKSPKQSSMIEAATKIYKEEGLAGFFRGLRPALFLVINPVIQFTVFERLRLWWEKRRGSALNGLDFFILGALSKLCATSVTYPYIVIKSRMQLKSSGDASTRYVSLLDGLRKIIRTEGVRGLYNGIESKLLQSVLSSAFTFAFKEEFFSGSVWVLTLLGLRQAKEVAVQQVQPK